MVIDSFDNLAYNNSPNRSEENGLICSWNHKANRDLMLVLVINRIDVLNTINADLFASDACSDAPALRIALSNGQPEIMAAVEARAPNLLEVVKAHNPDIEELMDKHPSFERMAISGSTPASGHGIFGITVSTKRL